jgi:hypothetical protein
LCERQSPDVEASAGYVITQRLGVEASVGYVITQRLGVEASVGNVISQCFGCRGFSRLCHLVGPNFGIVAAIPNQAVSGSSRV